MEMEEAGMEGEGKDGEGNGMIYATWLCGKDRPLWNDSLTWSTGHDRNPDITPCFRSILWTGPPFAIFFLILLPIELRLLFRSGSRDIPLGTISVVKTLAAVVIIALATMDLAYEALNSKGVRVFGKLNEIQASNGYVSFR